MLQQLQEKARKDAAWVMQKVRQGGRKELVGWEGTAEVLQQLQVTATP